MINLVFTFVAFARARLLFDHLCDWVRPRGDVLTGRVNAQRNFEACQIDLWRELGYVGLTILVAPIFIAIVGALLNLSLVGAVVLVAIVASCIIFRFALKIRATLRQKALYKTQLQ